MTEEKTGLARLEEEGEIAADYLEELLDITDLDGDLDIDVENGRSIVAIVASSRRRAVFSPIQPKSWADITDMRYRPILVGEVRSASLGSGVACQLSGGRWLVSAVTKVSK